MIKMQIVNILSKFFTLIHYKITIMRQKIENKKYLFFFLVLNQLSVFECRFPSLDTKLLNHKN